MVLEEEYVFLRRGHPREIGIRGLKRVKDYEKGLAILEHIEREEVQGGCSSFYFTARKVPV